MRSRTLTLVLLFLPSLLFAISAKYKDWANSPQAYFMTKAERAQWRTVVTDEQAEKFVNDFLAARGPGFAEMVADRAANADKYLTVGKTPGSRTLRGKIIVLLGPPTAIKTETKKGRTDRSAPVGGYSGEAGGGAGAGGGQGVSINDMISASNESGMGERRSYVEYTITYAGDTLPAAYAKGVTLKIDADPQTGEEWAPDRKAQAELDDLFETVAASRAAAAKPAQ
jgi:GWxTD domain-containing protein